MKRELVILNRVGLCKNCFRKRRPHSAYCGECRGEKPRIKIYQDSVLNFPYLKQVIEKFKFDDRELATKVFTYGDTVFFNSYLSYGIIAHELTHIFQQLAMGPDKWWEQYLKDAEFRLGEEVEAYQSQYSCYKENGDGEFLRFLVGDLSGKMYGNIISEEDAKQAITKTYASEN